MKSDDETEPHKAGRFSCFLTNFPWVFILIDTILVAICGPVAVWQFGLPDFADPVEGFEPRGTEIAGRRIALSNLNEELTNGTLSYFPPSVKFLLESTKERQRRDVGSANGQNRSEADYCYENNRDRLIVVEDAIGGNLYTVDKFKAMCSFEEKFITKHLPASSCGIQTLTTAMSNLHNVDCNSITQDHLDMTLKRLDQCQKYYFREKVKLNYNCLLQYNDTVQQSLACPDIPWDCMEQDVVYDILHYFTDDQFKVNGSQPVLRYAAIFLPSDLKRDEVEDFYLQVLEKAEFQNEPIHIAGMKLGIKFSVFQTYVIKDIPLFGVAMGMVVLIILVYTRSAVLVLTVIVNVAFTLAISYFLYFMVFRMVFFPFMNLLAGLLLIAIGADDVFILNDIWTQYLHDKPEAKLAEVTSHMLHHGVMSIFVTSFTTSAALIVNLISDISAIKCFGIFSGICVLVNFFIMITLTPSIIILIEKAQQSCSARCHSHCCQRCQRCFDRLSQFFYKFWSEYVSAAVTKIWFVWFPLLLAIGAGGLVVVFGVPKLSLPTSQEFQLLDSYHTFEVYDNQLKDHFRFEQEAMAQGNNIHVSFVWGVDGDDAGDPLDPDNKGTLTFDDTFDPYAPTSQEFLVKLCTNLFIFNLTEDDISVCFMHLFKEIVEGPCEGGMIGVLTQSDDLSFEPCCELTFPLNSSMARTCYNHAQMIGFISQLTEYKQVVGAFLYDDTGNVKVFKYDVPLKEKWTAVYSKMSEVHETLRTFMQSQTEIAPEGMKNGWFGGGYGDFYFLDLQGALATGTFEGIAISLAIGFIVLLITTCNIIVVIYAIVSITLIIATTVGALVLQGWELNISESLTITLAVGLSIDFTIHFGVAYKLSKHHHRKERVIEAISMVGSAVTMAALTTFLAGASIVGANVLYYQRFGIFLMIVMVVSWAYSLFFFLPLCCAFGPNGNFGNLMHKKCIKTKSADISPTHQARRDSQQNGDIHKPGSENLDLQRKVILPPIDSTHTKEDVKSSGNHVLPPIGHSKKYEEKINSETGSIKESHSTLD